MAKKYYWLKLKRDFFKRHDIRIIEEMPNGKDYILFYLKMLLESIDHEGELRFSDTIPYNEQMLSVITNTNIDIVKSAMKIFIELKMIEIFDDSTIFMGEVQRLIGSETAGAERVRKHRQNQKALQCNAPVTKSNTEIEKDIEIDTEIHIEIDSERINKVVAPEYKKQSQYQLIADMYNEICISLPSVKSLSDNRKKAIKARLNKYSVEQFKELFTKAQASEFLTGSNGRNWAANFDWLIKDANFAKVLDGNYDNKVAKSSGSEASYDLAEYEKRTIDSWEAKPDPKTAADDESIRARAEALRKQFAE